MSSVDTIGGVADADELPEPGETWRFVVCGDNSLAFRLADELANRHHGDVTVIVPSRTSVYGARIDRLAGVRVIEADRPHPRAFAEADLSTVDSLALVDANDVANIDAALAAHEINPDLRMVVRMFNPSLGVGMAELPYCTVLSDGALAAPAFVAAALGDTTTRYSVRDDTMYVTHRREVSWPGDIVCGLASVDDRVEPEILPERQDAADLVLVEASRPRAPAAGRRLRRLTNRYPIRAVLGRVWRRARAVLAMFGALLVLTAGALAVVNPGIGWWQAAYQSVLVAFGGGSADPGAPAAEKLIFLFLLITSFLLLPLLIGAVVDAVIKARLELSQGTVSRRAVGHVVVVGLGVVGSHVIQTLYDQGVDIVAIDRSADARGAQLARDLRIPLIIGDATRPETLLAASVPTCRALMVITSDDVTNLETALIGRAIPRQAPGDLQIVLRLFDGEFADRIQHAFNLTTSRSVSYLAVPAFAARMLGRALETIPVGRHVLLVTELEIGDYSTLNGRTVGDLRRPGEAWLLGLTTLDGKRLPWTVTAGRRLHHGERLLMVATRDGLARLIAQTTSPPDTQPRPPLVIFEAPRARPAP